MSIGREGGRLPRQVRVLLVTVVAATALWSACRSVRPSALFPSPGGIDSTPRSSVLSIARSRDYDTTHGVGDYRRLMVGRCPACTYGAHVFMSPELGAWRFDSATLAVGRFLARLINRDSVEAYPKFNLAPRDTVYWWVDKRGPGNTWRSIYVSSDPRRALNTDSFERTTHIASAPWGRALARFVWQDTDETLWVACDMTGCCRTSGGEDIY